MRALVRGFDRLLSRAYGIFPFWNHPDCLLRLQLGAAPRRLDLPGAVIPAGAPALVLHLWNEHLPPLPEDGADLAWARQVGRRFVYSLYALGRHVQASPRLSAARAVGGVTVLLWSGSRSGGARLMERMGFTIFPYRRPLGRFGEFWENFYSWWLMWAYNPASLRRRQLARLQRAEIWMAMEAFLQRYGGVEAASAAGELERAAAPFGQETADLAR